MTVYKKPVLCILHSHKEKNQYMINFDVTIKIDSTISLDYKSFNMGLQNY